MQSEKRIVTMQDMQNFERLMASSGHLRTFLSVVESGNVTHAAAALGRTQSTISVQIRQLEETLNVQLFKRQARGVQLTEEGRKLLPAARRTLEELQRVGDLFGDPLRGRIRVGIPDDYDDTVMEKLLATFSERHPEVEIFARSGCTSKFPEAISLNKLDLAVCSGRNMPTGEPLSTEPNVWAAAERLELEKDAPVPLAILDRACWWRELPTLALAEARRPWTLAYSSESFASMRAAIRAGLAVGVMPRNCLEPSMKVLTARDGFPPLPASVRVILTGAEAPADLAAAMSEAIHAAVA